MTDLGSVTALSVVDPHNDFISEGGKIWERIKGFAETNNCVPHTDEQEKRLSDGGDSRQRSSRCQLPRAHHTSAALVYSIAGARPNDCQPPAGFPSVIV
jgi:hypothetical protein